MDITLSPTGILIARHCTGHPNIIGKCRLLTILQRQVLAVLCNMNPPAIEVELSDSYSRLKLFATVNNGNSSIRGVSISHWIRKKFSCDERFYHYLFNTATVNGNSVLVIGEDDAGRYLELDASLNPIQIPMHLVDDYKRPYCGRSVRVYCDQSYFMDIDSDEELRQVLASPDPSLRYEPPIENSQGV